MLAKVEIDPNYKGPMKVESFLQKLKGQNAKARIFSKFTKRWFVLDLNFGTFSYSRKQGSSKTEVSHSISDILSVEPNPRVAQICDWKFVFNVETRSRMYVLYSESVNMHNLWCVALRAVVKPFERPRAPLDSDSYQNARDADAINPDRRNPSGWNEDDKFYNNPQQANAYDPRLPNQDRGVYQEPRASTKPSTKRGYNKLEDFPSHPDDINFPTNESDFRTLPPPQRIDEEAYQDRYNDPKRVPANIDYKDPSYKEPDPYRREEEVQAFKPTSDIREDPNQIRRERIGEVPSAGSSYNPKPAQREEYYQPPKENYRQQSPIETNQYARKSNQNQWGEPSNYSQPKYQSEEKGYSDPYGSKPSNEPASNFDRSRGSTNYNREEGYGYQEPQRKEVPRYDQRSFQTEPRNPAYNPLKRDDPYSGSRGYQDSSTRYQNEESYPSQTRASPYTQQPSLYASTEYQNYPSKSENAWGNQPTYNQQDSWGKPQIQKPQKYQEAPSQGLNPQGVDRNWDSWDN